MFPGLNLTKSRLDAYLKENRRLLTPVHQLVADLDVPVHQLVHIKVLVVVPERIVEGLGHLQPTKVEQELQAAQHDIAVNAEI